MKSVRVLWAAAVWLLAAGAYGQDPGSLGPGKAAVWKGWTLSLRAQKFGGALPDRMAYYSGTGPVTAALDEYPVIVLEGPGGRWEYPALHHGQSAWAVTSLRFETDWDGDGRPEVAAALGASYLLGSGVKPSGYVGTQEVLLMPASGGGWRGPAVLGRTGGDETGGEAEGLALALVPGREPEPVRWTWEDEEAGDGRAVTLSAVRLDWNRGSPVEKGPTASRRGTGEAGPRVVLADDRVNLRQGPGTGFPSLGLLARGTVLEVKSLAAPGAAAGNLRGPWLRVVPAGGDLGGRAGYVLAWFCSLEF